MDSGLGIFAVAAVTLAVNVVMYSWGGGWRLSKRLTSLEDSITATQAEIKKLSDVLIKMADIRGELRVHDERMTAQSGRITIIEKDIREMRHGDGFVRGPRGIDKEYP